MPAPICVGCGSKFAAKRAKLGYKTCMLCADTSIIRPILLEVSKSNPTVTLDPTQLLGEAFVGRKVESAPKVRPYVSLRSFKDEKLYKK